MVYSVLWVTVESDGDSQRSHDDDDAENCMHRIDNCAKFLVFLQKSIKVDGQVFEYVSVVCV